MSSCEREGILVSACLLGQPVRYDGKSQPCAAVQALAGRYRLVPVCPECLGGLPVPRDPSEIVCTDAGERVLSSAGTDVTEAFRAGARRCLEIARENACTLAVLKSRSPSCGSGLVHDGTFSGALRPGDGIAAQLLAAAGVRVVSENEVEAQLGASACGG